VIWCVWAAFAGVSWESPPVVGVETVVVVRDSEGADAAPLAGATVRVRWRPGLPGTHEQTVGITDGRGRVRWTPDAVGVASLAAGDAVAPVRVASRALPTTPATWLVALVVAGLFAVRYGRAEERR